VEEKKMSRRSGSVGWVAALAFCAVLAASAVRADEYRTWTNSTGKHKIEAKFESLENGKVKLLRKDGKEVTIELTKLSRADQEYVKRESVKAIAEKARDREIARTNKNTAGAGTEKTPANGRSSGSGTPKSAGEPLETDDWTPPAETRTLDADMTGVPEIVLDAVDTPWQLSVSPPAEGVRPKSIKLPPLTDLSERARGMAVSHDGKTAAIAFCRQVAGESEAAKTRVVLCDLQSGRVASASGDGEMAMLALADDGRQILVRRDEFMPGTHDRLEIWRIKGKQVVQTLVWTPFKEGSQGERDVTWAKFLGGDKLAVCNARGQLVMWDLAAGRPLWRMAISWEGTPAVSPDRKWIACTIKGYRLAMLDVEKQKIVATTDVPRDLIGTSLAFSPSGKRLACVGGKHVLVWDTATGKREKDFNQSLSAHNKPILFPNEDYLLAREQSLVHLDSRLLVWRYLNAESMCTVGDTTLMATHCDNTGGAILAVKLPQPEALAKLKTALAQSDFFVYKKGTPVKIDVSALPDADGQRRAREALTKKFAELGCPVKDDAQVEVLALIEGPEPRAIDFFEHGKRQVQEYFTGVRFMYQGKVLWQSVGTNIPSLWPVGSKPIEEWLRENHVRNEAFNSIAKKEGVTLDELIEAVSQHRGYEFYEQVGLPENLQKPSADGGAEGARSGESQVTPEGFR
jgi:WD40 repeat protein